MTLLSTAKNHIDLPLGKCSAIATSIAALIALLITPKILYSAQYFVDCASGDDRAIGGETMTAWRTLDKVNHTIFSAGDRIQLKRGTTCQGMLWPKGSGVAERPIVIGAYGSGALPVIDATGFNTAVKLFNQHHWEIRNLEARRSTEYGIHVGGTRVRSIISESRIA